MGTGGGTSRTSNPSRPLPSPASRLRRRDLWWLHLHPRRPPLQHGRRLLGYRLPGRVLRLPQGPVPLLPSQALLGASGLLRLPLNGRQRALQAPRQVALPRADGAFWPRGTPHGQQGPVPGQHSGDMEPPVPKNKPPKLGASRIVR